MVHWKNIMEMSFGDNLYIVFFKIFDELWREVLYFVAVDGQNCQLW